MPRPSKTINPLHFEDLEPHRFEDLIRQLIYDFRTWRSLEATGRSGSDEGMDIRAVERFQLAGELDEEAPDNEPILVHDEQPSDRLWIIQCKREAAIGPRKVRDILSSNLGKMITKPYGYILAAACDFSKSSRDAFREEATRQGIQEFYIWGKAEVEDRLFLPKNDHLLFAYFGISLQVRRRSLKTDARARLSLKRKLTSVLGEITMPKYEYVLIRDPRDETYPFVGDVTEFVRSPRWRYWLFYAHAPPDHLAFVYAKRYAYLNFETKEYDILNQYDDAMRSYKNVCGLPDRWEDPNNLSYTYHQYWYNKVPEANRAYAYDLRIISYDRIIAIDDIGDSYNQAPHLLVEYCVDGQPFELGRGRQFVESDSNRSLRASCKKRCRGGLLSVGGYDDLL